MVAAASVMMLTTSSCKEKKAELVSVCGDIKGIGEVDYVAGWFWKCAEMIQGTDIRCALVSTNSITQGEQPAVIFRDLYKKYDFSPEVLRFCGTLGVF